MNEADPVVEIESYVERCTAEHLAFWGCDDPVCALASSRMFEEQPKLSWWRRLFRMTGRA